MIPGSPGWLVSHDGGEHARLRTIVAPAFSNRRVKLLAQQVEAIAAQLFETLAAQPQSADRGATSPFRFRTWLSAC